jgi:hypothetical protein
MKEHCILSEHNLLDRFHLLLNLYHTNNSKNSLQELEFQHIVDNIEHKNVKAAFNNIYYDLVSKINYEIYIINNQTTKKGSLPRGYSIALKIQPDVGNQISESLYNSTGIKLNILNIEN